MQEQKNRKSGGHSRKIVIGSAAVVGLIIIATLVFSGGEKDDEVTYTAKRGNMTISVMEGGTIEATEAQVIKSKIEQREGTTILKIIEEGYQVSEEDVRKGLVLVELDSSAIEEEIRSHELEVQSAMANYMETVKEKEIRESRNLSNIKSASLEAKFALLDFKKYLGAKAADKIIEDIGISEDSIDEIGRGEMSDSKEQMQRNLDRMTLQQQSQTNSNNPATTLQQVNSDNPIIAGGDEVAENAPSSSVAAAGTKSLNSGMPMELMEMDAEAERNLLPKIRQYDLDFSIFTRDENVELLGDGQARQELRKLMDSLLIAESEFSLRKKTYEGSVRLAKNGFLTENELQDKKITFEKTQNALQAAQANLQLFKTYDIQKQAEQLLLNYEQALMRLSRAKKDAIAEMADSVGDVNRNRRRYEWTLKHMAFLQDQLASCTIVAERPGLVVYGDGSGSWDPDEVIREGAKVRQRQAIITIPDMRYMALEVKIHESKVKRVKKGMPVTISADAEPDRTLEGVVENVSVLPDSENERFNPDQKVYKTRIAIKGINDWVKPGMAAMADILIREIEDTIIIPVQAVFTHRNQQAVIVSTDGGPELRRVEVEDYNNRFAAVRSGVQEDEVVYLKIPNDFKIEDEYFVGGDEEAPLYN